MENTGLLEDRVQRRLDKYRTRHDQSIPRFEHTVNGINEQQKQDTLLLRQRFLEPKVKKSAKKTDKKIPPANPGGPGCGPNSGQPQLSADSPSNTTPTSTPPPPAKIPKRERGTDESDRLVHSNDLDNYDSSVSTATSTTLAASTGCNGSISVSTSYKKVKTDPTSSTSIKQFDIHQSKNGSTASTSASTLPPTTSSASSNLKSNSSHATSYLPITNPQPPSQISSIHLKQESNHISAFADLDQCAAALEKDRSTSLGLIEGTSDGLIASDTLKDLISEISDLNPDFIGDFDFAEDCPLTNHQLNSHHQSQHSSHSHQLHHHHQHHHSQHLPPVTVSSPTTASSRQVKIENSEYSNPSDNSRSVTHHRGNQGVGSTVSPLPHHPSHTPPFATGIFETSSSPTTHSSSGSSTPNYCPPTTTPPMNIGTGAGSKPARIPYTSPTHDSPAAQTLKQMAEHHQHKQFGLVRTFSSGGGPPSQSPSSQSHPSSPARSPFPGEAYVNFSGDYPSQCGAYGNLRPQTQVGDVMIIKQETPPPPSHSGGMYGVRPTSSYPTSPIGSINPLPTTNTGTVGKKGKHSGSHAGNTSTAQSSKSFIQAHLNQQPPVPQVPSSTYHRRSFSPPTTFTSNPSANQNQAQQQPSTNYAAQQKQQQMVLHHGQQSQKSGIQVPCSSSSPSNSSVPGIGMGGGRGHEVKSHLHYYQQDGIYTSTIASNNNNHPTHDHGQTINFTQQHLRMGRGMILPTTTTNTHQQLMMSTGGLPTSASGQTQPSMTNHMSRTPPTSHGGPVDINHSRMSLDLHHHHMRLGVVVDNSSGNDGSLIGRFNTTDPNSGRQFHHTPTAFTSHRQPTLGNTVYHHQSHLSSSQPLGLPSRHQPSYHSNSTEENKISNPNPTHQHHHQESTTITPSWLHQQDHQHTQVRHCLHQQRPSPPNHHSFHPGGMNHSHHQSTAGVTPPHHHLINSYAAQHHHHLPKAHCGPMRMKAEDSNGSGSSGLVLKMEAESSEFNLDLLDGDDYGNDAPNNYQNILDSL